ncbi:NADH-quinone oxidoreductase subunit C [Candidatus Micrarchaeota archaeon]|nr:NADH-quinone oxidoreductase subunit C [Candidatus Micrarchaeota archaeon]
MINVVDEIKKIKADRLISITSVPKDGGDTLYYHFSFNDQVEIKEFSIEVPKGEKVESAITVYENAALLEAELTELFGVKFEGNPHSGQRLFQAEGSEGPKRCINIGTNRVKKDA